MYTPAFINIVFDLGKSKCLHHADFCFLHLAGLNSTPPQPLPQKVRFLAHPVDDAEAHKGLMLSTVSVPVLSKHSLGTCVYVDGLVYINIILLLMVGNKPAGMLVLCH